MEFSSGGSISSRLAGITRKPEDWAHNTPEAAPAARPGLPRARGCHPVQPARPPAPPEVAGGLSVGEAVLWLDSADRVRLAVGRPDFVAARPLESLESLLGCRLQSTGRRRCWRRSTASSWAARRVGELVGPVPYDAQLPSGLWVRALPTGQQLMTMVKTVHVRGDGLSQTPDPGSA